MCLGFCSWQSKEGEWKDIYGDPVRPRRTGYECPPDLLQLGAWAAIIILAVLHYMIQIPFYDGALFIVVLVITSVLVATTVVTKIILEVYPQHDPVVFRTDLPRLDQDQLVPERAPEGTEPCVFCRRFVQLGCKHCSVCDKCVPGFDHHCRWLNSCVGEKNYMLFATFMGAAWLGMAWVAAFSLYTIQLMLRDITSFKRHMRTHAYHSPNRAFPALVVFNFVCLIIAVAGICALGKLICFHIYLHWTHQSTYEHIVKKREKKRAKGEYRSRNGEPEPTGICACLALHRRRNFKKHSKKIENRSGDSSNVPGTDGGGGGGAAASQARDTEEDAETSSEAAHSHHLSAESVVLHAESIFVERRNEAAVATPASRDNLSRGETSPLQWSQRQRLYPPVPEGSATREVGEEEEGGRTYSSSTHEPVE